MLRMVCISELIAAISSEITASSTTTPTEVVYGEWRVKPGSGTVRRVMSGLCWERMTTAWTTAFISSLPM